MRNLTLRRLIANTGIAALLFTQLAVAAYGCPVLAPREGAPVAMADDIHAAMPDCEKHGSSNPHLCLQHCQAGSQTVQTTPQVSIPAITTMPLAVLEPVQLEATMRTTVLSAVPERATSPPPLVRFRFLRI